MSSRFYYLYFITDDASPLLNLAFEAVMGYENLQATWIDGKTAIEKFKEPSANCCFVFSKFTGEIYDYFKALGSSVFGPQVLLDYLREERPLPNVSHPLFSTALRNANVTVTSVTGQQREHLFSSIEMLHGIASRNLTDEVNVIVTPKVGSKKYIVGASRGLHILSPEWIEEAWRLSETVDPINMLQHNMVEKFKLPIFAQLVVCVSGLSLEERKEVAKIVETNGGQYSGEMKIGVTTHLVVKSSGGVKYNFAKKWKIRIVSLHWLTDSVKKGYALDETGYSINEGEEQSQRCHYSTPSSSVCADDPSILHDISAITDPIHINLDETRFSCLKDVTNNGRSVSSSKHPFFGGCVFLLYGCNSVDYPRFIEFITSAGGVLCADASDKVSDSVTHVIIGPNSKFTPQSHQESNVLYVTSDWLEKCYEQHKRVPEEDFRPTFLTRMEPPHQNDIDNKPPEDSVDNEEIQLINQYFQNRGLTDMDDFLSTDNNPEEETIQAVEEPKPATPRPSETNVSEEITVSDCLFSRLIFKPDISFSFDDYPALFNVIKDEGGSVINDSSVAADYTVCSYILRKPVASNMVTPYWINCCVNAKTLLISELDTQVGFRPIHIPASTTLPLDGCVISLSGFIGNDRVFLTDLARELGAVVQECFLRKPVPSRNLVASTHLIAARPDGRKWPASKQWGLPAVSCSWLYTCATTGRRAVESEHPVKEEDPMVPPNWSQVTQLHSVTIKTMPDSSRHSIEAKQLRTPGWVGNGNQTLTSSPAVLEALHVSPPMSEQISRCLKTALSKTNLLVRRDAAEIEVTKRGRGILDGVVVCVAKSLSDRQVFLNDLVKQLGGDFRWNFDVKTCTHMIACPTACFIPVASPIPKGDATTGPSPQTLLAPDIESALKEPRVKVVLPQWLHECQRLGERVPEADFAFHIDSEIPTSTERPQSPSVVSNSSDKAPSPTFLGDVERRLESVMGKKAQPLCGDPNLGLPDASHVHRRGHRTRRRHLPTFDSGSDEFASSNSNAPTNDFALPAQFLQVRWQYEDSSDVKYGLPSSHAVRNESPCELNQANENTNPEKLVSNPQQHPQPNKSNAVTRVFSISGVNQDEKVRYQAIITELGADLDLGLTVGEATTHLIIGSPSRCEKYLMCMAGGLWILHKSYLDACAAASSWLPEEAYEWGGPGTEPLLIQLSPATNRSGPTGTLSCGQLRDLAKAARHWRKTGGGAFKGWKVIFGPDCDRESSFRRIIEFGGGEVLANNPPYPPADQVTHAFIKRRLASSSGGHSSGPQSESPIPECYQWLRVDFLCAHLTGMGSAPRSEFLVSQTAETRTAPPAVKRSRTAK